MATTYVESGQIVTSKTLYYGDWQDIRYDGIASTTMVYFGGGQNISAGGVASNTTISSGGCQYVSSGGVANGTTIFNGGYQYLSFGGVANSTTISSGGCQYVSSGGVVENTVQKIGGRISISVHGSDDTTKITGSNASGLFSYSNGIAINFIIYDGGNQYVTSSGVASNTTISSGGIQDVFSGGVASNTTISSGGSQSLSYDGITNGTTILSAGLQHVYGGGMASDTTISSGGSQAVDYGGMASGTTISSGGSQTVDYGGMASGTTISSGGSQTVHYDGVAIGTTIASRGVLNVDLGGVVENSVQEIGGGISFSVNDLYGSDGRTKINGSNASGLFSYSNGVANNFILYYGGSMTVYDDGVAIGTTISNGGILAVHNGGLASGTIARGGSVSAAGTIATATVMNGGILRLDNGATAIGVILQVGAKETVAAGATDTGAKVAGTMRVAGTASKITIQNSGLVAATGTIKTATIQKGGTLKLNKGAKATAITLKASGSLVISSGGTASMKSIANGAKLSLKTGGTLKLAAGNILYGKNTFTGATVTGGTKDKRVSLAKKAALTVGTNTTMKKLHLNASNATITVTGTGNTLGSLQTNNSTNVSYDVSKLAAKGTAYMLSLPSKNTLKLGAFSINVKKGQGVGTYELSKNIAQAKNTSYTINLAGKKQGIAKVNGLGLIKDTAVYTVNSKLNNVTLTVAKATAGLVTGKTKLTGTNNWEVFYGGKGNDTITGKNGRDVAVYDKTTWGKDTIAKTSGTMTLLFKDLKSSDIKKSLSGSTMTITKKSDSKQKITVKGWSDNTHSIVFGSGMNAFDKFMKAASPSTAQTTAARNEAFKKAGLASA